MIYVIGNKGLVGSAICEHFERRDVDHIGINRKNYQDYVGKKVNCVVNANGSGLKGRGNENPKFDFEKNVRSTLDLVLDFKSDLFIHISSIDVYSDSNSLEKTCEDIFIDHTRLSPYGFDKYLSELIVQKYTPKWLILRLGGLVGKGLKKNPIYDWSHNKPFFISESSKLNFIHTEDVAEIVGRLIYLNIRNEIINVCSSDSIQLKDLDSIHKFETNKQSPSNLELRKYLINTKKLGQYFKVNRSNNYIKKYLQENLGVSKN